MSSKEEPIREQLIGTVESRHIDSPLEPPVDTYGDTFEYTEVDYEKWREGTENFKKFIDDLREIGFSKKSQEAFSREAGTFQSLFLGERSAVIGSQIPWEKYTSVLKKNGLKLYQNFVYNPDLIPAVAEKYPDIFTQFSKSSEPEEILSHLSSKNIRSNKKDVHIAIGLLLGFPYEDIHFFEDVYRERNKAKEDLLVFLIDREGPDQRAITEGIALRRRGNASEPNYNARVKSYILLAEKFVQYKNDPRLQSMQELTPEDFLILAEAETANIYGNAWVSNRNSVESRVQQHRLHTAFESSGILDVPIEIPTTSFVGFVRQTQNATNTAIAALRRRIKDL